MLQRYNAPQISKQNVAMPQKTQWNPAFSVGNSTLDEQHKKLLAVCAALEECCEMQGQAKISRFHELLDELARYVWEHFKTEERILARCGYVGLEDQKVEHLAYEEKLVGIIADAAFGQYDIQGTSLFMSDWWPKHILESDMKYKEHLLRSAN